MEGREAVEAAMKVVKAAIDVETLEYMTDMIADERESRQLSPADIAELIGPFLTDAGCDDVDSTCRAIFEALGTRATVEESAFEEGVELGAMFESNTVEGGYYDPYLGLKKVDINVNLSTSINDALKAHKELMKQREKQLRTMREWEKAKLPLPPPIRKHGDRDAAKLTDIVVDSFSVAVAGRELLHDAPLKFAIGRKYGLVGRNGIGKSTLLGALARGEIAGVNSDVSVGCVEQEINFSPEETPLDAVLAVDVVRTRLLEEEIEIQKLPQTPELGIRLAQVYQRLQEIEAAAAVGQAAAILAGLGFSEVMQSRPVLSFSGGWRMRVVLARALFSDPDILCLDEPTNHLDLHAVAWLSNYISNWDKTCVIVSHARHFLNAVCTDIIEFKNQTLTYYKGNYDAYEQSRADAEKRRDREVEAQAARRAHVQQFIDRFRYSAARAALVQSRIKELERMPMFEAVAKDPTLNFGFPEPETLSGNIAVLQDAFISYKSNPSSAEDYILRDVCFSVDMTSRIAVCGVNGSGKSTLLKVIAGQLEPKEGAFTRHGRLRVGYFCQHHVDQLDMTLNAVQQLQATYPDANLSDEAARTFLGQFGISGLLALEPLYILSGGQKSRVALAVVAFRKPHVLVMDEPTNHLDLDAVQALISSLVEFKGGVVIVSHDAHLLSCVVEDVWHVDPESQSVERFMEDFNAYKKSLLSGEKIKTKK